MRDNLNYIIDKLLRGEDLEDMSIDVSDKGDYWMLNYDISPESNEYNKLTRGLVVAKDGSIASFPFVRFRNKGEKGVDPVNISDSEMLEKMDGTMVGVFFAGGGRAFHTRKMLSLNDKDWRTRITSFHGKTFDFLPTIGEYVNELNLEDDGYSYVFEFIHEMSRVVTRYSEDQYGLYLIGGRRLVDFKELSEDELDSAAARMGCRRPRRWHSSLYEVAAGAMRDERCDFEGFVFRDKRTGNRLKDKEVEYLRKHRLLDETSYKNLLPLVLAGEEAEILAYFPHIKPRIDDIKTSYENFLTTAVAAVERWRGRTKKEAAAEVFESFQDEPLERKRFLRHMVMIFLDKNAVRAGIDSELKRIALGHGKNAGSPKRLIDIIGIHNEEV